MKKAVFYITVIVGILCSIADVTGLQLLPLALAIGLMAFILYAKKNLSGWLFVLSTIMILINVNLMSLVDIILWVLIAITYFPRD